MGTGVPGLSPEHLWPTGDMPPELRSAMAAEVGAMNAAATHEIVPSGIAVPPREFDAAALEAERPPIEEGDALLASLRKVAGKNGAPRQPLPRPSIPTFATPVSPADMHYAFPLSADGNRAEVNLYGQITAADIELLVNYLKLTARKIKNGKTANPGVSEHDSARPDEKLPAKRSRSRTRER